MSADMNVPDTSGRVSLSNLIGDNSSNELDDSNEVGNSTNIVTDRMEVTGIILAGGEPQTWQE